MTGYACVDDEIIFAGVFVDRQAADDFESVPVMKLLGDFSQNSVQLREWKCFPADESKPFIKSCSSVSRKGEVD